MGAFVRTHGQFLQTATQQALTITLAQAVTAGNHLTCLVERGLAADTLASVTASTPDEVAHVDWAGFDLDGVSFALASIYFPSGASIGATITFTWTGASAFNFFGAILDEFSGFATSSWWDVQDAAWATGFGLAPASAATPNAVAAGTAYGIVIGENTGNAFTQGAGWTKIATDFSDAGSGRTGYRESRASVGGTPYTTTGTLAPTNETWGAFTQLYKDASGGGAPTEEQQRIKQQRQAVKRAAFFCLGEKWTRRGGLLVPARLLPAGA